MKKFNKENFKICVFGLGYVGLPLAARFSLKGFNVIGFDINDKRIKQLSKHTDINNDVSDENLEILIKNSKLTSNIEEIKECNIFIVTVPTPINDDKTPDLKPLISSSEMIGSVMKMGAIVIYESTVYPGVTDEVCTPILEAKSNLIFNEEFSTGYSPERVVPGDKVNTIEKIKKVVSASNIEALEIVSFLYSSIIEAGIYEASSIKVAEAAKVTENIQRDVNIALMNEMHQLYSSLNIDTNDVIEAASSKWNFMKLSPGLVGGHCISIDPYYLMHKSKVSGFDPVLMRSARDINDNMHKWVIKYFFEFLKQHGININTVKVTLLGYTFKENCHDIRNTKVHDLAIALQGHGIKLDIWDPYINHDVQVRLNKIGIEAFISKPKNILLPFVCVYHNQIIDFLKDYDGPVFDYKKLVLN